MLHAANAANMGSEPSQLSLDTILRQLSMLASEVRSPGALQELNAQMCELLLQSLICVFKMHHEAEWMLASGTCSTLTDLRPLPAQLTRSRDPQMHL